MKNNLRIILFTIAFTTGCASMFIGGGSLVTNGYRPLKIIAQYRVEGAVPPNVEYLLIETEKGKAIFEKSPDGSGTLFQTYWNDKDGDHYSAWVKSRHGYEYIMPTGKTGPVKKYLYPAGFYSVQTIGGVARPVPSTQIDPVATLYPKN
jgi:hypothetical protein